MNFSVEAGAGWRAAPVSVCTCSGGSSREFADVPAVEEQCAGQNSETIRKLSGLFQQMGVLGMFLKPSCRIGAGGRCFQISAFQLIYNFLHKLSGDSLAAEGGVNKSVVDLHCFFVFPLIGKCDLSQQSAFF